MIRLREATCSPARSATAYALRGYAGVVPDALAPGDHDQVLNMGGVLGRCTAGNPDFGPPFDAECSARCSRSRRPATGSAAPRTSATKRGGPGDSLECGRTGGLRRRHLHGRGQDDGRRRDRRAACHGPACASPASS